MLKNIIDPNVALEERVTLALNPATFRAAGHQLVDEIADFLAGLPRRPVTTGETPESIRELIGAGRGLPEDGTDAETLLTQTTRLLFDHSLFNGHPRFLGYVTSSPSHIGILADFLAAAVNPNTGAWMLSPVATEIEAQVVRWIAELVGYPTEAGGLLVSGGNVANSVGLLAARAASATWDIRKEGAIKAGSGRLRVYASTETHTWIQKATDLAGIGTDAIRWIPVDEQHRVQLPALWEAVERDMEAGDLPMAVVGTAGTVSTGAVDPLYDMAALCKTKGIWLHVDGAYGGFAAAVPGVSDDLGALGLADSVALDPHKWLYAPLEAGCVLVRDPEFLRNAFSYHPPYYHFGQEATNYYDLGPQNSRGFRALKVWLALRQAGRSGYARMIGDDIRLSNLLCELLDKHPAFSLLTRGLSITTFQYVPEDLRTKMDDESTTKYLNQLNERLLTRLQESGEAFVSNSVVHGRYALRACIVNFNTRQADIEALPGIIERLGREVDETIRTSHTA